MEDPAQQQAFEKARSRDYVQFICMRIPQTSHIPSAQDLQQKYHPVPPTPLEMALFSTLLASLSSMDITISVVLYLQQKILWLRFISAHLPTGPVHGLLRC